MMGTNGKINQKQSLIIMGFLGLVCISFLILKPHRVLFPPVKFDVIRITADMKAPLSRIEEELAVPLEQALLQNSADLKDIHTLIDKDRIRLLVHIHENQNRSVVVSRIKKKIEELPLPPDASPPRVRLMNTALHPLLSLVIRKRVKSDPPSPGALSHGMPGLETQLKEIKGMGEINPLGDANGITVRFQSQKAVLLQIGVKPEVDVFQFSEQVQLKLTQFNKQNPELEVRLLAPTLQSFELMLRSLLTGFLVSIIVLFAITAFWAGPLSALKTAGYYTLSILIALCVLRFLGQNINYITMMGVALAGFLVMALSGFLMRGEGKSAGLFAAKEPAILFLLLMSIVSVPFFAMQGVFGEFLYPLFFEFTGDSVYRGAFAV